MTDLRFMRAAIAEARNGLGLTSPNPAVGAVVVRGGRIIARGWHRAAGQPHAEIEALRTLKNPAHAKGATIYITLEPCCTHGRTPPCTHALIAAGIARVVFGATDPNPAHAGRAIAILRAAKIKVTSGVLAAECEALNPGFNHWIRTGLPLVTAKAGISLDGRLTRPPGEGQWLTSEASRADAMRLRASADAILIGAATLRADNPRLTLRDVAGRQPLRVILAGKKPLPKNAHVFTDGHPTLVYRGKSLRTVLRDLGKRGCTSILIEGGGKVLGRAFTAGLVDRVVFYLAPLLCGGPATIRAPGTGDVILKNAIHTRIGSDIRLEAEVRREK